MKEARQKAAASEYFFLFSSSAEKRMAAAIRECDGVSVSTRRTSNNARLGLPYNHRIRWQTDRSGCGQ